MGPILLALAVFLGTLTTLALGLLGLRRRPVAAPPVSAFATAAAPSAVTEGLGRQATPSDPAELDLQRQELVQAGFRGPRNLEIYVAIRAGLALAAPAIGLLLVQPAGLPTGLLFGLVLAAGAYYAPWLVVASRRAERQRQARAVLPDLLDMLVSCLEAGLGLNSSFQYVSRELSHISPSFAAELDVLNAGLQAGLPRAAALRALAERVRVDEVSALVNLFAQAERYGTGISQSIRSHAQMSRRRRLLDAERLAAEAAPELTVAMVLFVLPPLFIVLLGPTIITVTSHMIPDLEGR